MVLILAYKVACVAFVIPGTMPLLPLVRVHGVYIIRGVWALVTGERKVHFAPVDCFNVRLQVLAELGLKTALAALLRVLVAVFGVIPVPASRRRGKGAIVDADEILLKRVIVDFLFVFGQSLPAACCERALVAVIVLERPMMVPDVS